MEATQTNAVATLLSTLVMETAHLCSRDLQASPEGMIDCTQDGKCRNMLAMAAELIGFNNLVANVISGKGGSFPTPEERDAFAATINTQAAALAGIEASAGAVCAAIEGVDADDWSTKIMAPWGMEVTKAHMCAWSALHMAYHDGQINLIQILNGDHEVHWMS